VRDESPAIGLSEVADVLRRVLRKESRFAVIRGESEPGQEAALRLIADGFTISVHHEAGRLDYVEWAEAPDGRYCAFDDWYQAAMKADQEFADPLEMLSEQEQAALQAALSTASGAADQR